MSSALQWLLSFRSQHGKAITVACVTLGVIGGFVIYKQVRR